MFKKLLYFHHVINAPAQTLYKTQNTITNCYKTQKHLCRGVKLAYYLPRKTRNFNSLVQNISRFLQNETLHCRETSALGPWKLNIWFHNFTWSGSNSQKIVNFIPIMGSKGPKLNDICWIKWTNSWNLSFLAFFN